MGNAASQKAKAMDQTLKILEYGNKRFVSHWIFYRGSRMLTSQVSSTYLKPGPYPTAPSTRDAQQSFSSQWHARCWTLSVSLGTSKPTAPGTCHPAFGSTYQYSPTTRPNQWPSETGKGALFTASPRSG